MTPAMVWAIVKGGDSPEVMVVAGSTLLVRRGTSTLRYVFRDEERCDAAIRERMENEMGLGADLYSGPRAIALRDGADLSGDGLYGRADGELAIGMAATILGVSLANGVGMWHDWHDTGAAV